MNQPQPGKTDSTATADRLRELERSLAYELCCSALNSDLRSAGDSEDFPEDLSACDWFEEDSDIRTDELIPEVIEYLELRGLIQRDARIPGYFAVRDESEGVA